MNINIFLERNEDSIGIRWEIPSFYIFGKHNSFFVSTDLKKKKLFLIKFEIKKPYENKDNIHNYWAFEFRS